MFVQFGSFLAKNYERRKLGISFLIWLLIILMQTKVANNERIAKLTNIECKTIDPKYVFIKQCKMKAYRNDVTAITVQVMLLQGAVNNITLKSSVRKRGVETGTPISQFTVDFCAFLRNKRRNLWAELVYRIMGLEKWSNLNHTCPIDHDVLLDGYRFENRKMGKLIPFPNGHYTFTNWWYTYNALRMSITVHYQLNDI